VIHGVSAGAGSVATHLTAYGGRNDKLFIGAVGESPFLPWQPKVSEFEWQFDRFAQSAGCGNATDQMSCLRGLDVAYLQNRNKASTFPNGTAAPKFYWTPTVDGDLIRDYPARMIASGRFIKVPVLFGDDTDEGTSFAANASTPAEVAQFMTNYYPKLTSANTDSINAQYPLMAPLAGYAPYFPSASAAYGESTFTCPGISVAQAYNQHADPSAVWLYRYNGQGPDGSAQILVTHTVELPAIFGTRMTGSKVTSFESYNAPMVDTMMNYWISFVKTLNPNTLKWTEAPVWETFGVSQQRIMLQTNKTAMETVSVEQAGRCLFWKNLAVAMEV
jgi:acetylcholinesterase